LAAQDRDALVASAEESVEQVAMRAGRLGIASERITLVSDDDVDAIVSLAADTRPELLIVDSIQTVGVPEIASAPGGVAQARESAARLIRLAQEPGIALVLVGHVTKDGGLAGPELLEHMVDAALYIEGDPDGGGRGRRSNQNRFGAALPSGMFEMGSDGLVEVGGPSKVFLQGGEADVAGTVVDPAVEGRRSVLVEIQALVVPTSLVQPRRSIRGLDTARVNQVIAVLQRHCGLPLHDKEVYVNVVGGWKIGRASCRE